MPADTIQEDVFPSDEEFDDEEGDTDSSTDVEAKLAEDDVFDVEFLKCYSALKKKDDKIYDKNVRFFTDNDSPVGSGAEDEGDGGDESGIKISKQNTGVPKMTLLDLQMNLGKGHADHTVIDEPKIDLNQQVSKSYYEKELEEIKKSIEKVGQNIDSESDDDLLVVKSDSNTLNTNKKGNRISSMLDRIEDEEDEDIQHLKQVWTNPEQLSEEDKYLRDYILNKRYLQTGIDDEDDEKKGDDKNSFFSKNLEQMSDADSSDDERDIQAKDKSKISHHYEEKDSDKIVRIPRNSTKTIRDMVEKQEKKERRMRKLEKERKRKKALKDADCEDIVADIPTKFHYRETEPNDYGLSAEELLMATDEELDKWIGLHECVAYKSKEAELAQKRYFESKRHDMALKRKVFKSIYGDDDAIEQSTDNASSKKSKGKSKQTVSVSSEANNKVELMNGEKPPTVDNRKRSKKKRIRGLKKQKFSTVGVAPDRLLSYGLSKTKLKREKLM